jgi:hypothetical protein
LNSDVNARLGRGDFLPLVAMLDILSGAEPLMVDVRQSGSRSRILLRGSRWPRRRPNWGASD